MDHNGPGGGGGRVRGGGGGDGGAITRIGRGGVGYDVEKLIKEREEKNRGGDG